MDHAPMLTAAMVTAALLCAGNAALAQEERIWRAAEGEAARGEIELYRQPDYRGGHVRAQTAVPDLGLDWPVRSIRLVSGDWRICTGVNYTGNCAVMRHSIASISDEGDLARIRSISPAPPLNPRD